MWKYIAFEDGTAGIIESDEPEVSMEDAILGGILIGTFAFFGILAVADVVSDAMFKKRIRPIVDKYAPDLEAIMSNYERYLKKYRTIKFLDDTAEYLEKKKVGHFVNGMMGEREPNIMGKDQWFDTKEESRAMGIILGICNHFRLRRHRIRERDRYNLNTFGYVSYTLPSQEEIERLQLKDRYNIAESLEVKEENNILDQLDKMLKSSAEYGFMLIPRLDANADDAGMGDIVFDICFDIDDPKYKELFKKIGEEYKALYPSKKK